MLVNQRAFSKMQYTTGTHNPIMPPQHRATIQAKQLRSSGSPHISACTTVKGHTNRALQAGQATRERTQPRVGSTHHIFLWTTTPQAKHWRALGRNKRVRQLSPGTRIPSVTPTPGDDQSKAAASRRFVPHVSMHNCQRPHKSGSAIGQATRGTMQPCTGPTQHIFQRTTTPQTKHSRSTSNLFHHGIRRQGLPH